MPSNRNGKPIYYFVELKSWHDAIGSRVWQFNMTGIVMRLRWSWNPPWVRYKVAKYQNLLSLERIRRGFRAHFNPLKLSITYEFQIKSRRRDDFYNKKTEIRRRYEDGRLILNKGQRFFAQDNYPVAIPLPEGAMFYITVPREWADERDPLLDEAS